MTKILIAGCGYVGIRLAEILRDTGHRVVGLRRTVSPLPIGIEPFSADLEQPSTLSDLPRDLDFVVYAAAANGSTDAAYRAAYVTGVGNLLAALESQAIAPRRIFFTSSTGVYPQDDGSWVDERTDVDSPPRVDRVREGERRFEQAKWSSTIVRFGGIYGPGRTRLIESVRNGTIQYRREPAQWTNRIHREDCARALAHLIALPDPAEHYVAVDDEPAPLADVAAEIARRLGVAVPPPTTTVKSGGGKRCSNALLRSTGYSFAFPTYRDGYADLLGPGAVMH